ncbi:helix-turn-helix domain-containing protein [Levilactobacillus enshiensis]|uniref:helix-turn-helix domain-containing protein n=1 Tax=Levilactobacillus enshiensis TaxID=2590213 RepID=UPI00131C1E4F|nr:helix-turn-helix domain-containing protein [Levilactobacillus enshiensis]
MGERLKLTRQQQNFTQQDVASRLHVARQTVSSWETGHSYPDIDSLLALSNLYQLSLDQLMREDAQVVLGIKRQTVRGRLKNVRWPLVASAALFLAVWGLYSFSSLPLEQWLPLVVFAQGFLNLYVLNGINKFQQQLALTPKLLLRERYPWLVRVGWLPALLFLGIGGWLLARTNWLGPVLFTMGIMLLAAWGIICTEKKISRLK